MQSLAFFDDVFVLFEHQDNTKSCHLCLGNTTTIFLEETSLIANDVSIFLNVAVVFYDIFKNTHFLL